LAQPIPSPCPCGAGKRYSACCARWHDGSSRLQAPDAEALMRSRYSAYVLDLADYLRETWHPDTRPPRIEPDPPGLTWLGLNVKRHIVDDADHARVEFVARYRLRGKGQRIHELSRFARVDGRWYYVDGDVG
jgi:SEC-C motif-containing protein